MKVRCDVYRIGNNRWGDGDGLIFVLPEIQKDFLRYKDYAFLGDFEFEKEFLEKLDKLEEGQYEVTYEE